MSKRAFSLAIGLGILSCGILPVPASGDKQPPTPTDPVPPYHRESTLLPALRGRVREAYSKLPLAFEANLGQTAPSVKFLARGAGYTLFLTATEAILSLSRLAKPKADGGENYQAAKGTVLHLRLLGANPSAQVAGIDELPGKNNYFIGNDPAKWRTNVPTYARVKYRDVYPGVDLVHYGSQGNLEHDFVVAPGADPQVIEFEVDGAEGMGLNARGDLVLGTAGGQVLLHKPEVSQQVDGVRQPVRGGYVLGSQGRVRFRLGTYDPSRALVIDPVLSYSTYLGGRAIDVGYGVAVDSSGNAYVAGSTSSQDFPVTRGSFSITLPGSDVVGFVTKFNPSGSALLYSTYLNSNTSSSGAIPLAIAVDSSGNAYLTGTVKSSAFPVTAGAFQKACKVDLGGQCAEAFVTKLNPAGNGLIYSTYLGGTQADQANAIAVDSAGAALVTGLTTSSDFPTANAVQAVFGGGNNCSTRTCPDAFITKLSPDGSALIYSTYLGGTGFEAGRGIAADKDGSAYVAGDQNSSLPATRGAFTATCRDGGSTGTGFLLKLSAIGAQVYLTVINGCGPYRGVAVDRSGSAYVTGNTNSREFPTTQGAFMTDNPRGEPKAFVLKFSADGASLIYSTLFSGGITSIAVDGQGNAFIGGQAGADLPVTADAVLPVPPPSSNNGFVTKLNASGTGLIYSTFVGGSSGSTTVNSITLDLAGNAYITGATNTSNFLVLNAFQPALATNLGSGGSNAFLSKLNLASVSPTINAAVNGGSFADLPLAGATIASLFGTNLASNTAAADSTPLPLVLAGVTVQINGFSAPLFYASPTQINFQVPWEVAGLSVASVTVTTNGVTSNPQTMSLAVFGPGLFTINSAGTGQGAILIAATGEVAARSGSIPSRAARPASRGEFVSIYCTGLGPVSNRPATGAPATSSPPSTSVVVPSVTIGGVSAQVQFSGLAPGFVGLYQVNVQVPVGAPTGDSVPLVLSIGGVTSNTVTIAVQ